MKTKLRICERILLKLVLLSICANMKTRFFRIGPKVGTEEKCYLQLLRNDKNFMDNTM